MRTLKIISILLIYTFIGCTPESNILEDCNVGEYDAEYAAASCYICTGKYAYAYHRLTSCAAGSCGSTVKSMSMKEAICIGRSACGTCNPHITIKSNTCPVSSGRSLSEYKLIHTVLAGDTLPDVDLDRSYYSRKNKEFYIDHYPNNSGHMRGLKGIKIHIKYYNIKGEQIDKYITNYGHCMHTIILNDSSVDNLKGFYIRYELTNYVSRKFIHRKLTKW